MVLPSSCRCGAGVKTIRQSSNSLRVRNPAPLGCVSCFIFIFLLYIYIFLYLVVGALYFLLSFLFLFFGNSPPTCRWLPFCFLHGTSRRHREVVEACGGVQRSQVNCLGELLPLFCAVILVFSFFFNYTPMEVVHPVGMLV